jgi:parallel beta-helix repeat protein
MKLKAVSGIMLTLLLLGMLTLASNVQPVRSQSTTIIVPDDYAKIQWAVGNASDGDTIFVRAGTYYEHVIVNKRVSLSGENRSTTIVDGSGTGAVIEVSTLADNVSISGFTVQNGYYGIYLLSDHLVPLKSAIIENRIRNNFFGIYLYHSKYNLLNENIIENNYYGIYSWGSGSNTIHGNTLKDNDHGVDLWEDSSNIIIGNILENNTAYGIYAYHSHTNIISGNTLENNHEDPFGFYGYAVWLDRSNGNEVISNVVVNNSNGIFVYDSKDNVVKANTIAGNYKGVIIGGYLSSSHYYNNTVFCNIIWNNKFGIDLYQYANYNKIYHNNFLDNEKQAYIDEFTSNNTWDDGYPSGGNYWSDYTGVDLYSGPYQNETGSDGIGDTPYTIDADNQDNYPLMSPWGDVEPPVADAGPDLTVILGTTVTFDGTKSIDDVAIKSYVWTFTDITPQTLTGMQPEYTFNNVGDFEVTLNVSDYANNWNTDTVTIAVVEGYTLTIYSSPTGVTFTVGGVSRTTPWSGAYITNTSVSLIMPEIHTVGDARYRWNQWSDGNTSRSRTVTMNANITLTAHYTGPYYQLTVTSSPITGITFVINGTPQITLYTEWLLEGSYTLVMPQTHNGYVWSHWLEDGDTNRIKTITLQGTTWTAVYVPAPPPPVGGKATPINTPTNKPELPALWIWLTILLPPATIAVFVKLKKKK